MSPQASKFAPLLYAGKLEQGLEAAAKAGFDAVEISLRQVDDLDMDWFEKKLSNHGLVVSAIATGRMYLEDSLCLSDTNPVVRKQLSERLIGFIQLARHLQTSLIIGGVRGKLSGTEAQKNEQFEIATATLQSCADMARESGVELLLEPINRYETNFINTVEEGLKVIHAIRRPGVKLLLDSFHMNIEEADPWLSVRTAGKHLGYMHFADSNRQAPGRGHFNFSTVMDVLAEIGYRGFITAEILPLPEDEQALYQAGNYLRSLILDKKRGK